MHTPRPYGLFGAEPQGEDAAAVDALMRRLTNIKQLSGVDSLKMTRSLPGGGSATAIDMGGVVKVIVQLPPEPVTEPDLGDGFPKTAVPMFFSGVITKALVLSGEPVEMDVTRQTRRRLMGYGEKEAAGRLRLQRFVIPYAQRFQEFEPKSPGVYQHTQYAKLRPTWYSGAMAQLVQIAGGYGRQDFDMLPEDAMERAVLALPKKLEVSIAKELGNVRLPGYTGKPPKDGKTRFDYKHHECHGVGFDSERKPWLIRVNARGVYAMPLPMVPATTTTSFKQWVQETAHDEEITWMLDRFGGMPSGEGFPEVSEDFEAWRRAGVIIKLGDCSDFYSHIAYSSACGWSFNARGTEAYNTCYDYDEAEGFAYGLTYKLQLFLSPAPFDGKLPHGFDLEDDEEKRALDAYLARIYELAKDSSHANLALKYKLRRVPVTDVLARMRNTDGQAEYDYWLNLEADPISSSSAVVVRTNKGWLHHPAKFLFQPQIKFPEPLQGECLSFDFTPLENGRGKNPKCDTIMFAYFIGDDIKTVKYFRDPRTFERQIEDNYTDCMTVGSWERTEHIGQSGIVGNFYTSDSDHRKTVAESQVVTNIVGKDKGYDTKPWFAFDAPFWKPGTMWRNRYFTHETTTQYIDGRTLDIAVCIPYLCRNAVLDAQRDQVANTRTDRALKLHAIQDPYSYRYWTYDFVMHWAGSLEVMRGVPAPQNASPVWVEIENYKPGPCSDFADSGPWVPGLPADYTWLIHPEANVYALNGGGGAPPVKEYVQPGTSETKVELGLSLSILPQYQAISKTPDATYFLSSPTDLGTLFYRDAAKVEAGTTVYANVSEANPDEAGQRKRFGYCRLTDNRSAHHFIGVINE